MENIIGIGWSVRGKTPTGQVYLDYPNTILGNSVERKEIFERLRTYITTGWLDFLDHGGHPDTYKIFLSITQRINSKYVHHKYSIKAKDLKEK